MSSSNENSEAEVPLGIALGDVPKNSWLMVGNPAPVHRLMTAAIAAGVRSDGLVRVRFEDDQIKEGFANESLLSRPVREIDLLSLTAFVSDYGSLAESDDEEAEDVSSSV